GWRLVFDGAAGKAQKGGGDAILSLQIVVEQLNTGEADDAVRRVFSLSYRLVPNRNNDLCAHQGIHSISQSLGIGRARAAMDPIAGIQCRVARVPRVAVIGSGPRLRHAVRQILCAWAARPGQPPEVAGLLSIQAVVDNFAWRFLSDGLYGKRDWIQG